MRRKTQARIVWGLFSMAMLLGALSVACGVLQLVEALR